MTREHLVDMVSQGVVTPTGLISHGRGEAFDYLMGERTIGPAEEAERAAAAMLLCLLISFPLMLFPLLLMACKELFMAVTGTLIIRKTGMVPGAVWHGKAATVFLYAVMLLHVFWQEVPPLLSIVSIAACVLMIALSFLLYAVRNLKPLCQ